MGCGGIIVSYGMLGILILGCIVCSIWEFIMLFSNGLQVLPLLGSLISLIGISVWMTKDRIQKDNFDIYNESFNRFLIISLDVLICRYSPLFRAFPALFISEEPHKSFYYPSCFRSQK